MELVRYQEVDETDRHSPGIKDQVEHNGLDGNTYPLTEWDSKPVQGDSS